MQHSIQTPHRLKTAFTASMVLTVACAATLGLTGCASNDEVNALRQDVDQLKEEMATLKQGTPAVTVVTGDTHNSTGEEGPANEVDLSSVNFTDLTDLPTTESKTYIQELAALGVFDKKAGEFEPYEPITRGQFVTWLYKAYNAQHPDNPIRLAPQADNHFSDLSKEHPSYKYAQAFAEAGYSVGYEDGTFKADQPITREEMMGIKVPIDKGGAVDSFMWGNFAGKFSDNEKIRTSKFAKEIHADVSRPKGHYRGSPFGNNVYRAFGNIKSFKPKQELLRFEAATALWQTDFLGKHTAHKALNPEKGKS